MKRYIRADDGEWEFISIVKGTSKKPAELFNSELSSLTSNLMRELDHLVLERAPKDYLLTDYLEKGVINNNDGIDRLLRIAAYNASIIHQKIIDSKYGPIFKSGTSTPNKRSYLDSPLKRLIERAMALDYKSKE